MEKDLFYFTRYLTEYLDDLFRKNDKKNGINTFQAITCGIINERSQDGLDTIQKDIQEGLCLSKASCSDLISAMCKEELIVKEKDKIDKRKDILKLTKKGEDFDAICTEHALLLQDEILSKLTKKESEELIRLLNKLVEKIKGGKSNGKEN